MARKVERGKPLNEMVKGSVEYWLQKVRATFYQTFGNDDHYIEETFADHVIVGGWGERALKIGEYYFVAMTINDDDSITFAPKDQWEVVELAYQPQSQISAVSEGRPKGSKRINEQLSSGVRLLEAKEGETVRKIRAVGISADVVNGNGRRYAAEVLRTAVGRMRSQLSQSPGQGRLVQLLGEAEHPDNKPSGRPNILETVIKWEAISFNESTKQVELEGIILPTSKGRDILTLLENGVVLPISQRAYGLAKRVKEDGQAIEEITDLYITGYDLVMEASDPAAQITESKSKEDEMDPEEIKALLKKALEENLELVKDQFKGDIEALSEAQLQTIEANVRKALGVGEEADLGKALAEAAEAKRVLEAQKHDAAIEAAIAESTKELKYGEKLNKTFVEAVRAAKPADAEGVKAIVESKRVEYDAVMAQAALAARGMRVEATGPVFETETGWPEFSRPSFVLTEAIRRKTLEPMRDLRKPKTVNEAFAAQYLDAYDKAYRGHLLEESRKFNESEQTSDLDLPYSVMRAIIAEAFPTLVATGIFDVEMSDQNPAHLYFETFAGETGYAASISSSESVVADLDDWVAMANKRITPGTVVIKDSGESTTYTEGTDYVIDYANGKFMALTGGAISNGATVHATAYSYTAIRKGEMATIERGKMTLSHKILALAADRLATQISREAVVFSRSQLNYDATSRTLASLVQQIQRKIDQGIMYLGLSAALSVASNSGGTWASTGLPGDFVEYVGVAKALIANRYYMPTGLLLSYTNADKVANWDGFTQAGARPDADLNANGYIGRIKGLAVFQSTEFSASYGLILNRELVMHRIGQPMRLFGPYPTYDVTTGEMIAAEQYYAEEFNGSEAPVPGKGAYVKIT